MNGGRKVPQAVIYSGGEADSRTQATPWFTVRADKKTGPLLLGICHRKLGGGINCCKKHNNRIIQEIF